jgi:hypothetical protein
MRVEAYWNLHKPGMYSIRRKGKVISHVPFLTMKDVQWVVQPAGNARVKREGKKNVHAFARGTWLYGNDELQLVNDELRLKTSIRVRYNPYVHEGFTTMSFGSQRVGHVTHSDYAKLGSQWVDALREWKPIALAYDYVVEQIGGE